MSCKQLDHLWLLKYQPQSKEFRHENLFQRFKLAFGGHLPQPELTLHLTGKHIFRNRSSAACRKHTSRVRAWHAAGHQVFSSHVFHAAAVTMESYVQIACMLLPLFCRFSFCCSSIQCLSHLLSQHRPSRAIPSWRSGATAL